MKNKVLTAAKAAVSLGLAHETAGNFSMCDREAGVFVITPSAVPRANCSPDDMCVLDFCGNIVSGPYKPSSETPMHTIIYRKIPGVGAIVHTHSPYATAYAVAGREIGPFAIEIIKLNGRVPVVPYATPGSAELGENAASMLKHYPVVLLQNHGLIAVGNDLEQALLRAVMAEDLAKAGALAAVLGGPKMLTEKQLEDLSAYYNQGKG